MKTLTTLILTALLVLSTSAQARPETGSDSRRERHSKQLVLIEFLGLAGSGENWLRHIISRKRA